MKKIPLEFPLEKSLEKPLEKPLEMSPDILGKRDILLIEITFNSIGQKGTQKNRLRNRLRNLILPHSVFLSRPTDAID